MYKYNIGKKIIFAILILSNFACSSENIVSKNVKDSNGNDFFPLGWFANTWYKADENMDRIFNDGFSNTIVLYHARQSQDWIERKMEEGIMRIPKKKFILNPISSPYDDIVLQQYLFGKYLNSPLPHENNKNFFDNFKNKSNLLGWYMVDEPELRGVTTSQILDLKTAVNSKSDIATYSLHTSKKYIINDGWYKSTDVVMYDKYPIHRYGTGYKYTALDLHNKDSDFLFSKEFPVTDMWHSNIRQVSEEIHSIKNGLVENNSEKPIVFVLEAERFLTQIPYVKRNSFDDLINSEGYTRSKWLEKNGSMDNWSVVYTDSMNVYPSSKIDSSIASLKAHTNKNKLASYYYSIPEKQRVIGSDTCVSYNELLYMTYTALVHGAKGIIYYGVHVANNSMFNNIQKIGKTLKSLQIDQIVMHSEPHQTVISGMPITDSDDNGLRDINYLTSQYKDKFYLIVVNDSDKLYENVEFDFSIKCNTLDYFNFQKNNEPTYERLKQFKSDEVPYHTQKSIIIPKLKKFSVHLFAFNQ